MQLAEHPDDALDLVREDSLNLEYLLNCQKHPHVVEAALRQNGLAFEFAS